MGKLTTFKLLSSKLLISIFSETFDYLIHVYVCFRDADVQCELYNMKEGQLYEFVYQDQRRRFLKKQQERIISKFGSDLELSFERKFLWG